MNKHPVSLSGGQTCFLMAFHVILRQISNYYFCAISSRKLSVCAISYVFFQLCSPMSEMLWAGREFINKDLVETDALDKHTSLH